MTHPISRCQPARTGLLKRVFDIGIEQCSQNGRTSKIIAAIDDPTVIAKMLTHPGRPGATSITDTLIRSRLNGLTPDVVDEESVCVTPKKLIGKPMGTAADEPSSFGGSASSQIKDSTATAATLLIQVKDKMIDVISDSRNHRPPGPFFIIHLCSHREHKGVSS